MISFRSIIGYLAPLGVRIEACLDRGHTALTVLAERLAPILSLVDDFRRIEGGGLRPALASPTPGIWKPRTLLSEARRLEDNPLHLMTGNGSGSSDAVSLTCERIEQALMHGFERNKGGWPRLTRADFEARLRDLTPDGFELSEGRDVVLSWRCQTADEITAVRVRPSGYRLLEDVNYTHVTLAMQNDRLTVMKKVEGLNPYVAYRALHRHSHIKLALEVQAEADCVTLEEALMHGLERQRRGWPLLTRAAFEARLRALTPEGLQLSEGRDVVLSWSCPNTDEIAAVHVRPSGYRLLEGNTYTHVTLKMQKGRLTVTKKVDGLNPYVAYRALHRHSHIDLAPEVQAEADCVTLEEALMHGLERQTRGWPRLTRIDFEARLRDLNPKELNLPEGREVVLSWFWQKMDEISAVQVRPLGSRLPEGQYTHVTLAMQKDRLTVTDVTGQNAYFVYRTLHRHPHNIKFAPEVQTEVDCVALEEALMHGLERHDKGWPRLTRAAFEARLRDLNPEELQLSEGREVVLSWYPKKTDEITAVRVRPSDSRLPADYTHVTLAIQNDRLTVTDVIGRNRHVAISALRANPRLVISPYLWAVDIEEKASERLLFRLSEFGRTELLRHVQEPMALTEEEGRRAARALLLEYANDYALGPASWPADDRRWTVALRLDRYLAGERFEDEEAERLSRLLMASFNRDATRQIEAFKRSFRQEGSAPISESGWDLVFSDELCRDLRAFMTRHTGQYTENPSQALLRDPYNRLLGAYYWDLLRAGEEGKRFEILSHLDYQKRRQNTLTEFYNGMILASGHSEDTIHAVMRSELKALNRERGLWEMDVEHPFRLTEPGIVSSAATFLWQQVLTESARHALIAGARTTFPHHASEIASDAVLSDLLPQSLFFEVLGRVAREREALWRQNSKGSYEEGREVLEMLFGMGDEGALGFATGFGRDPAARSLLASLGQRLAEIAPDQFRADLERVFTYPRYTLEEGRFVTQSVSVRFGDLLEGLLRGYTLREMANVMRRFRLHESGDEYHEISRLTEIDAQLATGEGLLALPDGQWLYGLLNLYTTPSSLNSAPSAAPASRWHLFETWLYGDSPQAYRLRANRLLEAALATRSL